MKRAGIPFLAAIGLAGVAHAADAPARAAPPTKPNCFGSLYDYLNSSPGDCSLPYAGFTLYGTIDAGVGWESHGAPFNTSFGPGDGYLISKAGNRSLWLLSPNALSSSVLGVKMSEPLGASWSLVGAFEFGYDPYSLQLSNSPRSLKENNGLPLALQSANGDSSRAGQIDNSQAYIGLSHPTFGTATFGRVNTLSLDAISVYDPMLCSNAFSPLGWSGSFAGFGDTEIARSNTAFKYRLEAYKFRFAGLAQVGGYNQGNGSAGEAQGQIGADFGGLSIDAIAGWGRDAVSLANYTELPKGYSQADLRATLSNNRGMMLLAKYKVGKAQLFGGYERVWMSNPSDRYPFGFTSLGGYTILPKAITYDAYTLNRILTTVWTGIRYAVTDKVDVAGAFYYETQNNYSAKPCKGTGIHISSSACPGALDALSFVIEYKPLKRLDIYAGVMLSNVFGGMASGYQQTQNIDPTVGLRVKF